MKRELAIPYVSYVVDDAGSGRHLGEDPHAIIRGCRDDATRGMGSPCTIPAVSAFEYRSVLVGWQCGFEPLFVAVHSYLDVRIDDADAEDMAAEYLEERNWFGEAGRVDCDYIIR